MSRTIVHRIKFKAKPDALFKLYADPKLHAKVTGTPAKFSAKPGSAMSAWDGYIQGKVLAVDPDRAILQTWRASDWSAEEPDSLLYLGFERSGKGTELIMIHQGVPDDAYEELDAGWKENYWNLWKAHLKE